MVAEHLTPPQPDQQGPMDSTARCRRGSGSAWSARGRPTCSPGSGAARRRPAGGARRGPRAGTGRRPATAAPAAGSPPRGAGSSCTARSTAPAFNRQRSQLLKSEMLPALGGAINSERNNNKLNPEFFCTTQHVTTCQGTGTLLFSARVAEPSRTHGSVGGLGDGVVPPARPSCRRAPRAPENRDKRRGNGQKPTSDRQVEAASANAKPMYDPARRPVQRTVSHTAGSDEMAPPTRTAPKQGRRRARAPGLGSTRRKRHRSRQRILPLLLRASPTPLQLPSRQRRKPTSSLSLSLSLSLFVLLLHRNLSLSFFFFFGEIIKAARRSPPPIDRPVLPSRAPPRAYAAATAQVKAAS
uniref:Semi-dwarf-2 n=1 Tax=Eragrostis tef TaxID=110835 RepID=H9A2G5_ERATE|nr:semi-dwarf-2 [Eragrostis tef]AFD62459.1 semi-dwarf-2 [Eragrostis tef]AFD62460.1 semi-dwarf-2 [Eragrostis tef]AFD62461.1 semi-dwarf-2 [Eragrostis tef]AFD62462.1 semi-dwarf-2 [Eragrostis tef]